MDKTVNDTINGLITQINAQRMQYDKALNEGYEEAYRLIEAERNAHKVVLAEKAKDLYQLAEEFVDGIPPHGMAVLTKGKNKIDLLALNAIITQLLGKKFMEVAENLEKE